MKFNQFRNNFFNPEKWIVTGLTWAVLTLLLVTLIGLVQGEPFELRMFLIQTVMFMLIGAPIFGLLFRSISRRSQKNARR
jgi:hypothetical protein